MRVIALLGGVNTGKSHTINIVYQLLLLNHYVQVPGHFRELGNPDFEDIIDVLQNTTFGKRVGIVGMGDYPPGHGAAGLDSLLSELQVAGCNIAVCACTDKPAIKAAVTAYPVHQWVDKTLVGKKESAYRLVNNFDAVRIYHLV